MTELNAALSLVLSLGVVTARQLVPFQCRAIGWSKEVHEKKYPTAQTSVGDTSATAVRTLPLLKFVQSGVLPGFGLPTVVHAVPFQCWVRVRESFRLLSF